MIRTEREFEAALEAAIALIDHQPKLDQAADARLRELLEAIKRYQPRVEVHPPEHPVRERLDALTKRLDEFQRQREEGRLKPGSQRLSAGGFIFPG